MTLVLAAASLLLLGGCSSELSAGREQVDNFAVEYTVETSGAVHVVETIAYDFGSAQGKHGIDRFLASRFTNDAGTERVYQYSNIAVTSPSGASALFSTSLSDAMQIRIGNQNATVHGKQSYVISYDIAGALNNPTLDNGTTIEEFYWNVTGNSWTVPIMTTSVLVQAPASTTQIACYSGALGSTTQCASAETTANGARFSNPSLVPGDGLTIDLAWPNSTFKNTAPIIEKPSIPGRIITSGSNDGPNPFWSPWNWATGLVLLIGIPLCFRLYVRLRRRDLHFADITPGNIPSDPHTAKTEMAPLHETIVVEYQPPAELPVGAAGSILNKARVTTDVTVTLIDLAVRGYLRIEEIGKQLGRRVTNFRLVKTPERAAEKLRAAASSGRPTPAALLRHEQLLLDKIFDRTDSITLSEIRNSFAKDTLAINASLDSWIKNGKFFIDKFTTTRRVTSFVIMASVLALIAMIFIDGAFSFIPIGAFFGVLLVRRWSKKAVRRSGLGHALYLQLEGFRLYIATAEADRIRFDEQEDIFSRYMPWAIVFGEAERWARVFNELADQGKFAETPDWYVGTNSFTGAGLAGSMASMASIGSAMSSFNTIAGSTMTATPASSGGSGFSSSGGGGGGSSSGGGGGGGGSW